MARLRVNVRYATPSGRDLAMKRADEALESQETEDNAKVDPRQLKRELTDTIKALDSEGIDEKTANALVAEAGTRLYQLEDNDRWGQALYLANQVVEGGVSVQGLHLYADILQEVSRDEAREMPDGDPKWKKLGNANQVSRVAHAIGKGLKAASMAQELPVEFLERIGALSVETREGRGDKAFTFYSFFPKKEGEKAGFAQRIRARFSEAAEELPTAIAVELRSYVVQDRSATDEEKAEARSAIFSALDELDEDPAFKAATFLMRNRDGSDEEWQQAHDRAIALATEASGETKAKRMKILNRLVAGRKKAQARAEARSKASDKADASKETASDEDVSDETKADLENIQAKDGAESGTDDSEDQS